MDRGAVVDGHLKLDEILIGHGRLLRLPTLEQRPGCADKVRARSGLKPLPPALPSEQKGATEVFILQRLSRPRGYGEASGGIGDGGELAAFRSGAGPRSTAGVCLRRYAPVLRPDRDADGHD